MYPEFARMAEEERFTEIATVFRNIAVAEKEHEKRYQVLLKNLEEGKVFKKDNVITWRCRNCGYIHKGAEAPQECPACAHPRAYFEVLAKNY